MVLVVRRTLLEELGLFQGLCFDVERYLPMMLSRMNNFFMPRSQAEQDPAFKQIIPYAVLIHEGSVLHYVRGKKSGEQRLVAKSSIGIGGHLNDHDEGLFAWDQSAYLEGVNRELREEVSLPSILSNRVCALLNDDSTEVGQVHLGVVHVVTLASDAVRKNEAMITDLGFLSLPALRERRANLETWSQLCLDAIERLIEPERSPETSPSGPSI